MKNIIITGSTGMVGSVALKNVSQEKMSARSHQ